MLKKSRENGIFLFWWSSRDFRLCDHTRQTVGVYCLVLRTNYFVIFSLSKPRLFYYKNKKALNGFFVFGGAVGTFARATIPDKQWVSTVWCFAQIVKNNFLLNASPSFLHKKTTRFRVVFMVEQSGLAPESYTG